MLYLSQPLLIDHFCKHFSDELKVNPKRFSSMAIGEMKSWIYKGNVRELRNMIERLYILIDNPEITVDDLDILQKKEKETDFWNETMIFKDKKAEFERRYLKTQLALHSGNLTETSRSLGLQISNLSRKIKELNIKE